MNKIVVACVTADDLAAIQRLSHSLNTEVVAVIFDFGDGIRLRELQDQACAAGARRCHVVDLREEFARDYLVPALQRQSGKRERASFRMLARACMSRKLAELAKLEGTDTVRPLTRTSMPKPFAVAGTMASPDPSARVSISFNNRVPVAVNDVPMSLPEVLESLATIGVAHGLDGSDAAMRTLTRAYREIGDAAAPQHSASLEVSRGRIVALRPPATT